MGCMSVPRGETVYFDLVTHHPSTGAAVNADSAPDWAVYGETSDAPVLAGSMAQRAGATGHYRGSFEASAVNGFDPGEFFNVVVSATVAGVVVKTVVLTLRMLAAESAAGKMPVDNDAVADAVLSRDVGQVESFAAEHSLCTVVLAALESSISSTQWTIRRTDGATTHVTKTVTTDPAAEPITGVS